jgi:hypothetical protein
MNNRSIDDIGMIGQEHSQKKAEKGIGPPGKGKRHAARVDVGLDLQMTPQIGHAIGPPPSR